MSFFDEVELINDRLGILELSVEDLNPEGIDIRESISGKIKRMPYKELVDVLRDSLNKSIRFEDIHKYTNSIEDNLREYQVSNGRQLANNLLFGTASALASVAAALVLVNNRGPIGAENVLSLVSYYVPWLALIVVIQFISYFFLRLYSKNIETERYLRNELTNVLSQKTSVAMALYMNDVEITKEVVSALRQTERNRFMDKGQTTVDLEEKRIESEASASTFEKAFELAKNMVSNDAKGTKSD